MVPPAWKVNGGGVDAKLQLAALLMLASGHAAAARCMASFAAVGGVCGVALDGAAAVLLLARQNGRCLADCVPLPATCLQQQLICVSFRMCASKDSA